MPRRPRLHLDGMPLHILRRGHDRQSRFFADQDCHAYPHWPGQVLKREEAPLHACAGLFVLIPIMTAGVVATGALCYGLSDACLLGLSVVRPPVDQGRHRTTLNS